MPEESFQDHAGVKFPPPLTLLIHVGLGVVLGHYFPEPILTNEILRWPVCAILVIGGTGLIVYCALVFKRAQTKIEPWASTSKIVTLGPFGFSRNPIYLSMMVIGCGIAVGANNAWIAAMMPVFAAVIYKTVIEREERYLERKFGDDYLVYKRNVKRWI